MRLPRWLRRRIWEWRGKRRTLRVKIRNLTPAQAEAIEHMLWTWKYLGAVGGSRWVAFYADGDGNFHPRIKVGGRDPKKSEHLKDAYKGSEYRIDFDAVAWRTGGTTE